MMYLIQHKKTKELQLVESLDGHADCKVLERNVTVPKVPHCKRVNGRWKIDKPKAKKAVRKAQLQAMSRLELVELVEGQIETLEKRLAKLEQQFTKERPEGMAKSEGR